MGGRVSRVHVPAPWKVPLLLLTNCIAANTILISTFYSPGKIAVECPRRRDVQQWDGLDQRIIPILLLTIFLLIFVAMMACCYLKRKSKPVLTVSSCK
jgi:hypothetical protein